MYRFFPNGISDEWLIDSLKDGKIPNMYPDFKFLSEHHQIIEKYKEAVDYYKGSGYLDINYYFRTGFGNKKTQKFAKDLLKLYNLVKPLPYDIVVYRGSKYTIGQDFMTGTCVKSRKYKIPKDYDDKSCPEMIPIKLTKNIKSNDNIRDYIYENLGFLSTTTDIFTALKFSANDTIIAYIIKAGTKFICPLEDYEIDYELEIVLFPLHNSFVLTDIVDVKFFKENLKIYVGIVSDELNRYRLPNHPVLQTHKKVDLKDVEKCIIDNQKPRYKCTKSKIAKCAKQGKYCINGECSHYVITNCENMDNFFWYQNHYIDYRELKQLKPYGNCDTRKLLYVHGEYRSHYICDPKDGTIVFDDEKKALVRLQKEVDHQKATGLIIDFDYPNMDIETLKTQSKLRGLDVKRNKDAMIDQLLVNDQAYIIKLDYHPIPKYKNITKQIISIFNNKLTFLHKNYKSSKNAQIKNVYKELFDMYLNNNKWFVKTKEYENISALLF